MDLTPPEGRNLAPALRGEALPERTLAWEHEGNRAIRVGSWKLVAAYRKPWELFDLAADRSECHNLAGEQPDRVRELAAAWQRWADRVGVLPWEQLPGASYKPSAGYRKTSERP
jgi:arylsulfatase